MKQHSHEIPVQLVCHHLLQQRLETTFEEHLKAQVVLDDQGNVQTAIHYLHKHTNTQYMYYIYTTYQLRRYNKPKTVTV